MRRLLPAALAVLLIAAPAAASTTTSSTTTTTTPPGPFAPLTGRPDPTRITAHRPAVTVKIDNTPEAHPQYGLRQADVVYEEIVEGGITRLAAVFNSAAPARVGPVRSVRRTDREIVTAIGGIFVFSGGAAYAIKSIETAPVKLFDESNAGTMMFRSSNRPPPHNLFANVSRLIHQGGRPRPPHPLFAYGPGPGVKLRAARAFSVDFPSGYAVSYAWDQRTASWDRSIFGAPDRDATGRRVSPANVVVMWVHYLGGVGVEGAEAVLAGRGTAEVFTRHGAVMATWTRSALTRPVRYRSRATGATIRLAPGQTWVELAAVGEAVPVTP
ncbi:MAG TPA: DUF3048 domain-containing protein [Acidimicrobiales bacterium]|nr:DUF3048 domain-containing protein [Acidimicrobiales bacterium]